MDSEQIQEISIWVLRVILVVGAVVAGLMGKTEVVETCGSIVIISFFLL